MNWAYDNLGQVASGKRFWQDGTPAAGQRFEYAFVDLGHWRTAGRGGDHEHIPNSGTFILECTGQKKKDKEAKAATAKPLWSPAVNNDAEVGRWAFLEIREPWDAQDSIRTFVSSPKTKYHKE
jgi:hypothetical protein